MQQKQQRILKQFIMTIGYTVTGVVAFVIYLMASIRVAVYLTNDGSNALIAIVVPLVLWLCWMYAKDKVERDIEREERLVDTIKRGY